MIKAVIFDLDGLLIDSEIISYKILKEMLEPFQIDFTMKDYAENFSGKTAVRNINYLITRYELPWKPEEGLDQVFAAEEKFLAEGISLKDGAKELLAYLKANGYQIALASSSVEDRAMTILTQHDIKRFFDAFAFGYEVKRGKPEPDIFLLAAQKLGEEAEHCLVLEDSEAGIQAAFSAGMQVICIPDMRRPQPDYIEKTAYVLDSLKDVIPVLKEGRI